ncbi:GNVR domain-containing protein [Mesorhizobium sp. WSM4935]|uniref:GNVR domain-containing protein n=1 Tax=Mesorhizobium sp. WSM4935 TaxID=3038547 RepID=UPI002414FD7A|nr:GNVR domain-containing protein [Mesorhizobium sp. WSM4935]MDG4879443.1 GNVR domain-containing protein [Mesorhizobium sp. WSM4935]
MELSPVGLIVCAAVLLTAIYYRAPLIVGLIASLAFGSTALMMLSSLGGSSPLIYTFFGALMLTGVAARRRIWQDLGNVFGKIRAIWVLSGLMFYAVAGAWLFPRLFAGQTSAFVQSKTRHGVVIEASLEPVSSNISQTGYFILGGLIVIALCILLLNKNRMDEIRRGFFIWCVLHVTMGMLDVVGKVAGTGDLLQVIRTASYAMLTDQVQAGFFRIAGAYSEASAFGAVSLACLSFCYVYWRKTGSRLARWLSGILLVLLLLCTSSTAYVGLAVLSVPVAFSLARSFLAGRVTADEILIVTLLTAGVCAVMAIILYNERILDPVIELIDSTVINKGSTDSGHERAYWNIKSLQSFADTSGLGVGFGSSRASSWPIAVISQLGLVGSLMMATLLAVVIRGLGGLRSYVDGETEAVVSSVRACALAGMVAASISGGTADPGIVFFVALAVVVATRVSARRNRHVFARQSHGYQKSPELIDDPAAARRGTTSVQWPASNWEDPIDREFISLSDITCFLRLYTRSIVGCLAVGILAAGFYVVTTDRIYRASTQILIEPNLSKLLQQQSGEGNPSLDRAQIESRIALMRSEKTAMMVIDRLNLRDDATFNQPQSLTLAERFDQFGALVLQTLGFRTGEDAVASKGKRKPAWDGGDSTKSEVAEFERSRRTMQAFQSGLDMRRVGGSYAIEISFSSRDPELSARIANATANALVLEQLGTKGAVAHKDGVWLDQRLGELRSQMNNATRIAQEFRARHDYSVARPASVAPAEGSGPNTRGSGGETQEHTLQELDLTADIYRKMYRDFLQAHTSSLNQETFPIADLRVITPASRPLSASYPRRELVVVFGALLGMMVGVGLAFIRSMFDKTIRSPRQVREELGLECVGELPPFGRKGHSGPMEEVTSAPYSPFSHSLRRVKTAIGLADTDRLMKWIGITSTSAGDDKCSAAINLASLYSMCGQRVLLVDADVAHPELAKLLLAVSPAPRERAAGLVASNIVAVPNRQFDMLLCSSSDATELLVPETMRTVLEGLESYDIVIIVLPSFTSGSKLAASSVLDGVILVARWGRTSTDVLKELVRSLHASRAPITGVLITGAPTRSRKHLAAYGLPSASRPFLSRLPLLIARIGNAARNPIRTA